MGCCSQCAGIEDVFGRRKAARDLRRYRRKGPDRTTRMLVEALRSEGVEGMTLLDVGGGVGAVQHELIEAGVSRATDVDAASHYLERAREEAARRGHADRVTYLHGDFVELADQVPEADVVTLDRVICCYPDMRELVARSAARARRLYGVVYPRDRRGVKLMLGTVNLCLRAFRNPFRSYVHPTEEVDAAIRAQGLRRRYRATTAMWQVVVYGR